MGGTSDYRTPTVDDLLERALTRDPGGSLTLTLDPAFQGLPATAHGGTVLAAFDHIAGRTGEREIAGEYRRRVPLGVPLPLDVSADGAAGTVACRLLDHSGTLLVEGTVSGPRAEGQGAEGQGRVLHRAIDPRPPAPPSAHHPGLHPLPVSRTCFACGTDNPIGLRVALAFDDDAVVGRWEPREEFRADDGTLAPVALTALLDEAAFWLGALASGESGMTTDLRVIVHALPPFGGPLRVAGRRGDVRPHPGDTRFWDAEVTAHDEAGARLATARITFVAVRGAARRLLTGLLATNPPAVLRRVFPAYAR